MCNTNNDKAKFSLAMQLKLVTDMLYLIYGHDDSILISKIKEYSHCYTEAERDAFREATTRDLLNKSSANAFIVNLMKSVNDTISNNNKNEE